MAEQHVGTGQPVLNRFGGDSSLDHDKAWDVPVHDIRSAVRTYRLDSPAGTVIGPRVESSDNTALSLAPVNMNCVE